MATKHNFKQVVQRYAKLKRNLPKLVGNEAIAFAKDNFRKGGFQDTPGTVTKWKKRRRGAERDKGRAVLVDTGTLKRSIRMTRMTANAVHIGSDIKYAKAHNEGARIRGTARVRAHQRRTKRGRANVPAHTRRFDFKLPKRQFIGPSLELARRINRRYNKELIKVFK